MAHTGQIIKKGPISLQLLGSHIQARHEGSMTVSTAIDTRKVVWALIEVEGANGETMDCCDLCAASVTQRWVSTRGESVCTGDDCVQVSKVRPRR